METLPSLYQPQQSDVVTLQNRFEIIDRAIKAVMKRDIDYGVVPGTQKPTLLKPGAEKLATLFHLAVVIPEQRIVRYEDWEHGIFAYEVVAQLVNNAGEVVGEGIGSANSKEAKYRNKSAFDLPNTLLKMAKKRAQVDAVLTATASSGRFTQDLEDVDPKHLDAPKNGQNREFQAAEYTGGHGDDPPGQPIDDSRVTGAQTRHIYALAKEIAWSKENLDEHCRQRFGERASQLTQAQASMLIDTMLKMKEEMPL